VKLRCDCQYRDRQTEGLPQGYLPQGKSWFLFAFRTRIRTQAEDPKFTRAVALRRAMLG